MAIVFYITNYVTKVEDLVQKWVVVAAELFRNLDKLTTEYQVDIVEIVNSYKKGNNIQNKIQQFLIRVINQIFTERPLLQVEVITYLLDYNTEFTNNNMQIFLNVSTLYQHIFQQQCHLWYIVGVEYLDKTAEETVLLKKTRQRISFLQVYLYCGRLLQGLLLYNYIFIVKLK